jgi:hypothetical protein
VSILWSCSLLEGRQASATSALLAKLGNYKRFSAGSLTEDALVAKVVLHSLGPLAARKDGKQDHA